MAEKARHAFGSSQNIQSALDGNKIDNFDILFLDGDTDNPKIGWIDRNGKIVLVKNEKADLTEIESDITQLETELSTKADAKEINTKIGEIETVLDNVANTTYTHEKIKYEISDVPVGTLVDYNKDEIRIMCPTDIQWTKQSVGVGGNPNNYYMTFKTYVPYDNVVGYREHLGDQADSETLTDLKTDKYGRRYQPTWLTLASYNEATDTWEYRGAKSTKEKYVGWDYRIDWYNADGKVVASDSVRINLSNEDCHSLNEPYYVSAIETKIEEIETKIAEASAIEVIEF